MKITKRQLFETISTFLYEAQIPGQSIDDPGDVYDTDDIKKGAEEKDDSQSQDSIDNDTGDDFEEDDTGSGFDEYSLDVKLLTYNNEDQKLTNLIKKAKSLASQILKFDGPDVTTNSIKKPIPFKDYTNLKLGMTNQEPMSWMSADAGHNRHRSVISDYSLTFIDVISQQRKITSIMIRKLFEVFSVAYNNDYNPPTENDLLELEDFILKLYDSILVMSSYSGNISDDDDNRVVLYARNIYKSKMESSSAAINHDYGLSVIIDLLEMLEPGGKLDQRVEDGKFTVEMYKRILALLIEMGGRLGVNLNKK